MKPVHVLVLIAVLATSCQMARGDVLIGVDHGTGELFSISTTDASVSLMSQIPLTDLGSLARGDDGYLYGFTSFVSSALYRIDPALGTAERVGALGIGFVYEGALAIGPGGVAWGTNHGSSENPSLFTVDLSTGAASVVGAISGGSHDVNGLVYRADGMLVGLDRVSNSLLEIDPASGGSSVIASVTPVIGGLGGMTTLGGQGYFATGGPETGGSNELWAFDLFTGEHSLVGGFSSTISGTGIAGLSGHAPEPGTVSLLAIGALGLWLAPVL